MDSSLTGPLFDENDREFAIRLQFPGQATPPVTRKRWVLVIAKDSKLNGLWWVTREGFNWGAMGWQWSHVTLKRLSGVVMVVNKREDFHELDTLPGARLVFEIGSLMAKRRDLAEVDRVVGSTEDPTTPPVVSVRVSRGSAVVQDWSEVRGLAAHSGGAT